MADMNGTVSSNDFKVKNVDAFNEWFDSTMFGDEIEVWVDTNDDGTGSISFGGYEQYPTAYPKGPVFDDPELTNLEEDAYSIEEVDDLQSWADELCKHLMDNERFLVVAGGNEKLRYTGFDSLMVQQETNVVVYTSTYSDEDRNFTDSRLQRHQTLSTI